MGDADDYVEVSEFDDTTGSIIPVYIAESDISVVSSNSIETGADLIKRLLADHKPRHS